MLFVNYLAFFRVCFTITEHAKKSWIPWKLYIKPPYDHFGPGWIQ